MEEVVIVDAARSPVGRKNGSLGGAHPPTYWVKS